jgi:hypothetical protein
MFENLKRRWKVSGFQLGLIICTFAIGGSLTGFIGKKIMNLLAIGQDWIWAIIYIILIAVIWPMVVIIVSIPLGQLQFFKVYIRKLGVKMGIVKPEMRSQKSEIGSLPSGQACRKSDRSTEF